MSTDGQNAVESCVYCGGVIRIRKSVQQEGQGDGKGSYCCSGCLFADSLSQSLKQDRLSLWMVGVVVTLFLVFNQAMLMMLGFKYDGEGYAAGKILMAVSLLFGTLAWGVVTGIVVRLNQKGQAPRPVAFAALALVFLGAFIAGNLRAEWLPDLCRAGLGVSILTVLFCFAQKWLLRPFRSKK